MRFGATEEEARAFVGEDLDPVECEVWPENWDAVMLFQRVQTQWRVGGMGGLLGLDYQAVESVLRIFKVREKAVMFDKLRVMEATVLEAMDDADQ